MKKIFFIVGFMVVGLVLGFSVNFAYSNNRAEEGQAILSRIEREKGSATDGWEPTGPTVEDIKAATKVDNIAVKGSLEDKFLIAVKNGDLKNVQTLITAGADLEARDDQNMTPLMSAAARGYSDIVRILIDAGADIQAQDKFRLTALFYAVDKNNPTIVKMLIDEGAADTSLDNMFMSSVFQGRTQMVQVFIESNRIQYDILQAALGVNNRGRNPEIYNLVVDALNKHPQ